MNKPPYRLVEQGVRGFEFDARRKRLLVWHKNRLGVVDLSSPPRDEEARELGSPIRWVFDEGRDIEQAFWIYEGSHVLFRDHDRVAVLELLRAGTPLRHELVQVRLGSSIAYAEETGRMYYLEKETGRCVALEVLPKASRVFFPMPNGRESANRSARDVK